jgi:hypothetical protein
MFATGLGRTRGSQRHFQRHQRHGAHRAARPAPPPGRPSFEGNEDGAARLELLKKNQAGLQRATLDSASSIRQARELRAQARCLESATASLEAALRAQQDTKQEIQRACGRLDSLSRVSRDGHLQLTVACSRIEALAATCARVEALAAICARIEASVEKQAREAGQLRAEVEQRLTLAPASSQLDLPLGGLLELRREVSDLRADVDRAATKHNCVLSGSTIVERLFVTARTPTGSTTLRRIGVADQQ